MVEILWPYQVLRFLCVETWWRLLQNRVISHIATDYGIEEIHLSPAARILSGRKTQAVFSALFRRVVFRLSFPGRKCEASVANGATFFVGSSANCSCL